MKKKNRYFRKFFFFFTNIPLHSRGRRGGTPRASVLHRRSAVFVRRSLSSARDLVQPTYLHKHDAPLCFPFSLRAPALHLLEKNERKRGRWRGPLPSPSGRKVGCEKRSRVESRQPNFATLASRYFDVSRGTGQGRRFFFFFKPAKCQSLSNDSQKRRDLEKACVFPAKFSLFSPWFSTLEEARQV